MKMWPSCGPTEPGRDVDGNLDGDVEEISELLFDSFEPQNQAETRPAENSFTTQLTVDADTSIGSLASFNEMSTGGLLKFVIFEHPSQNLVFQSDPVAFAADPSGQPSWKKSPEFTFTLEAGRSYHVAAISDSTVRWHYDTIPSSQNGISSVSANGNFSDFTNPQMSPGYASADAAIRIYSPGADPPSALAYVQETEFDHQFVSPTFTCADAWLEISCNAH